MNPIDDVTGKRELPIQVIDEPGICTNILKFELSQTIGTKVVAATPAPSAIFPPPLGIVNLANEVSLIPTPP